MSRLFRSDPTGSRFALAASRASMKAVVTRGVGGYEQLDYREVARPIAAAGEVLVQVLAAAVNNTDINTRVGWYASSSTADTAAAVLAAEEVTAKKGAAGWSGATPFPLIQGADCCGRVVEAAGVEGFAIGSRVLVRPCMRLDGQSAWDSAWMGSDFDGAFAQFVKVPASEVFPVTSGWSDAELATVPCAYGTAENLLLRAGLTTGERVLVTGASGGVGSAVVQLAKRRGAIVTAIVGRSKIEALRALGADRVIERGAHVVSELGENSLDLVIDNVAGAAVPELLRVLRRGGRYATSGAIAGPMVTLDMRTIYLKDLTLVGSTAWDEAVFPNLMRYIERSEIRPLVATTFPLARIADAQREFLEKNHVGKIVVIPPLPESQQR